MSAVRSAVAQDASARLIAAACKGLRETWSQGEADHDAARTQDAAREAAVPLLRICASCPIVAECREWAIVDEYTGIAAGTSWVDGVEQPVHWVRRHPPKKLAG